MLNELILQLSAEKLFNIEMYRDNDDTSICYCEMLTDKNYIAFTGVYDKNITPDLVTIFKDIEKGSLKITGIDIEALDE